MASVMTVGPAVEPVTVAEAKAHLRIDGTADDVLIGSLILTSRLHLESVLSLGFVTQSWTLYLDRWPKTPIIEIPMAPLLSVNAVRVKNASGAGEVQPAANYLVDLATRPGRLIWNVAPQPSPGVRANGVEIDFTVGFGALASSVPAPLRHAILLLVAHWYEHRDPVEIGSEAARIPAAISDLIAPFRKIRL